MIKYRNKYILINMETNNNFIVLHKYRNNKSEIIDEEIIVNLNYVLDIEEVYELDNKYIPVKFLYTKIYYINSSQEVTERLQDIKKMIFNNNITYIYD